MAFSASIVEPFNINPRTGSGRHLLALPTTGRCCQGSRAYPSATTTLAVRIFRRRAEFDRFRDGLAHHQRNTVSNGLEFRCSIPARQFDWTFEPLTTAEIRVIRPFVGFRGHCFGRTPFSPIVRDVVHAMRPDDVPKLRAKLDVTASMLHTTELEISDRNSLNGVPLDNYVWDTRNVLDEKPSWLALDDDSARLAEHFPAVDHARMVGILPLVVRHGEPLARRARHDSIQPATHATEVANVSTGDLVGHLDNGKPLRRERFVEQSDAGEEGQHQLIHSFQRFHLSRMDSTGSPSVRSIRTSGSDSLAHSSSSPVLGSRWRNL